MPSLKGIEGDEWPAWLLSWERLADGQVDLHMRRPLKTQISVVLFILMIAQSQHCNLFMAWDRRAFLGLLVLAVESVRQIAWTILVDDLRAKERLLCPTSVENTRWCVTAATEALKERSSHKSQADVPEWHPTVPKSE